MTDASPDNSTVVDMVPDNLLGPNKDLKVLVDTGKSEDWDKTVASNGIAQILGSTAMLVIYFVCRKKTPWVYYPNIKNKPQHPCYQHNPGMFSWIGPLITTKDTQLLSMVGLDGFMFLQMLKLLYRICFCLCLFVVPLLCYIFVNFNKKTEYFGRLSIIGITDVKVYWLVLVMAHLITCIVIYLVFIHYKRYVTLRQMYLAAPATMTSLCHMKKLSKDLGADQNAIDFVNVSSRSVIIDRLPSDIKNDTQLFQYIESLRIGEIESVSLIHNTYKLQKLYEERSEAIQDIEKEIAKAFIRLQRLYIDNKDECGESFGEAYKGGLEASADEMAEGVSILTSDKVMLFNRFSKCGGKFLTKTLAGSLLLEFAIEKLRRINDKIAAERKRLQDDASMDEDEVPNASETLYVDSDIRHDVSFFSWSQIINLLNNKDLFSLDLPIAKKRGFVTFKDQRSAGIIRQTSIGTRVFSSNVQLAPAPNDVHWRNINKDEVSGYFSRMLSLGLYILFNLFFLIVVVMIVKSLEIKKDTQNFIFKLILKNEFAHSLYKGILAPLIYNIFLFFVPIIIKALLHTEQCNSFSQLQAKLMYRLSLFLFFNAFLATIILTALLKLLDKIRDGTIEVNSLIEELGNSIAKTSVFFFNTIVQRLCVGSALVVLKPSPFLYNWLIAPIVIYTRRQEKEREFSPPIDFGNHIPNVLIILPMALVYSCICPMMLVVSLAFYVSSYFVYRNELLYASRNDFESGGLHWKLCVRFILFSLLAFQIITAIFTYSSEVYSVFYLFLPLIFVTYLASEGLKAAFENNSESFPMNAPEEKFLDTFSKKTLEERHRVLAEWKEIGEDVDNDLLPVSELCVGSENVELAGSYYRDPALVETIETIILPRSFFRILYFLSCYDKKNVTGLGK